MKLDILFLIIYNFSICAVQTAIKNIQLFLPDCMKFFKLIQIQQQNAILKALLPGSHKFTFYFMPF